MSRPVQNARFRIADVRREGGQDAGQRLERIGGVHYLEDDYFLVERKVCKRRIERTNRRWIYRQRQLIKDTGDDRRKVGHERHRSIKHRNKYFRDECRNSAGLW